MSKIPVCVMLCTVSKVLAKDKVYEIRINRFMYHDDVCREKAG